MVEGLSELFFNSLNEQGYLFRKRVIMLLREVREIPVGKLRDTNTPCLSKVKTQELKWEIPARRRNAHSL